MNGEQIRKELNYANTDFDSLRREMQDLIPLLTPRWTNVDSADIGMSLVNVFCGISDMLSYYFNEQAKETYLPTLRLRESLINVTKLIGYDLDRPAAPRTTLQIAFKQPLTQNAAIRKYDAFTTRDGQTAAVAVEDLVMLPGTTTVDIPVLQGEPKAEYFTATGGPLQRYELASTNVSADLVEVRAGETIYQELTRDIYLTNPDRLYVRLETDAFNRTTVVFSEEMSRLLPSSGETILVRFIETKVARLMPHMITRTKGNILLEAHTIQQTQEFTGGAPAITTEEAKRQAPQELKTLWRAVIPEDYRALMAGYRGVRKARVFDNNTDESISVHRVQCYIVTEDGKPMSDSFKAELQGFADRVKMVTTKVSLHDAEYVPIKVKVRLHVYRSFQPEEVVTRVGNAIRDHFSMDKQDFGQQIHDSALIAEIQRVRGVSHLELEDWDDYLLGERQFARYVEPEITVIGVV